MDKHDFLRIAVTVPYAYPGEARDIARILRSGETDLVHIRKPDATPEAVSKLVAAIPADLRPRLTLHDCHDLAQALGVGGVHMNRRSPSVPEGWKGRVSRSCHSIAECLDATDCDYVTLSPIYPSFSKPGYRTDFDPAGLRGLFAGTGRPRVIALGGVTPGRYDALRELGFDGAAMLTHAWRPQIVPAQFRLQFITNPSSVGEALSQAEAALDGGCRWIQLRWKDAPVSDLEKAARAIAGTCRKHDAVFIIDDHVGLADLCEADGVHLGKNDMPPSEARRILGPCRIIGATANTPDDIVSAVAGGADYIGYGPFRFTSTKKNLSPVLGLEGYRRATARCREAGITLPIVAIGGIVADDVPDIMATGVNGIAVSGVIASAADPAAATRCLIDSIANSK